MRVILLHPRAEHTCAAFNGLEGEGVSVLAQQLLQRLPSLASLNLSHNGCGGWVHTTAAQVVSTSPAAWLEIECMCDFRHVHYLARWPNSRTRSQGSNARCVLSGSGSGAVAAAVMTVAQEAAAHRSAEGEEGALASESELDHAHRQRGIDYQVPVNTRWHLL